MKQSILSFIIFMILSSPLSAAEPIIIDGTLNNEKYGKYIGLNIEYLVDKEKNLTIDDITSKLNDKKFHWKQSDKKAPGFGLKDYVYWVRFTVKNSTHSDIDWILQQEYPPIDYLHLYIPEKNHKYKVIKTGDFYEFSQRPIEHRSFLFPLKISANSADTYYLSYDTTSSINISLKIWTPETFNKHKDTEIPFLWLYYGFILVMIIYNLFIFVSVRDLSYLYYVLYISFTLMLIMILNGTAYQYLWPKQVWWANHSIPFSLAMLNVSLFQFCRISINMKKIFPTGNKIFIILLFPSLIAGISSLFISYKAGLIATVGLSAFNTCFTYFSVIPYCAYVKKSREAQFYMAAFFVLILGTSLMILKTIGLLPVNFITSYSFQIGSALEVVILSLCLADRINTMRKELGVLNLNLEDKVKLRTEELNAAMEELEAMNDSLIDSNIKLEDKTKDLEEAAKVMDAMNNNLSEALQELEKSQKIAERDMYMAADVQSSLFPKHNPEVPGWDIAFYFKPMSGVSGDMYDFYIKDNKLQGITICDVSGHGIASGLVTMIARSTFYRNFVKNEDKDLNQVIEKINKNLLNEITAIDNFLTAIILRFNDNNIEYVNAGHPDLICKRADSKAAEIMNLHDHDFKGTYLGLEGLDRPYEVMKFSMDNNDIILLYTDCLYENKNIQNEEYGTTRLISSFENAPDSSAQKILDHILSDFNAFIESNALNDDLTAIVLKKLDK